MSIKSSIAPFLTLLALSVPGAAAAQVAEEQGEATDAEATHDRNLVIDNVIAAGAMHREEHPWNGVGYLGVTALYRPSPWAAGLVVDVGGQPFGATEEHVGVVGGMSHDVVRWFRIDALAELGAHLAQPSTGLELFVEEDIVGGDRNAVLPYAGVRVSPTFVLGGGRTRFLVGTWLAAREDLGRTESTYAVRSCGGLFSDESNCRMSTRTDAVGGTELTGGVRLGVDIGL